MSRIALVRYGAVPEILRCQAAEELDLQRVDQVVMQTPRGDMLGTLLDWAKPPREPGQALPPPEFQILRLATSEDLAQGEALRQRSLAEIPQWEARIAEWKLDLQVIDLDFTHDGQKVILYVLNERGPDCTRLAIMAAAAGLGIIEVQPVSATGLVALPANTGGGGCGSAGGCGCHH